MQLAVVGLGRMGANIVRRLLHAGHECVVYDVRQESVAEMVGEGALGAALRSVPPARPDLLPI